MPLDADDQALIGGTLARALPVLLRLRFAVQADYFARRCVTGDLTGIDSAADNLAGLADARRGRTGRCGRML